VMNNANTGVRRGVWAEDKRAFSALVSDVGLFNMAFRLKSSG
jgi:hypothetical protein